MKRPGSWLSRASWQPEWPQHHGWKLPADKSRCSPFLVGDWLLNQTIWKNMLVRMGSSSPIFGVKIKNVWNLHLGLSGSLWSTWKWLYTLDLQPTMQSWNRGKCNYKKCKNPGGDWNPGWGGGWIQWLLHKWVVLLLPKKWITFISLSVTLSH